MILKREPQHRQAEGMCALPVHIRSKIELADSGCWLWTASRSRDGYGWTSLKNKTYQAHRLVFILLRGKLGEGMVLDHLCRVRHCVNPAHLEVVTSRENTFRSVLAPAAKNAAKTTCKLGHPFVFNGKERMCVVCRAAYDENRRESKNEYMKLRGRAQRLANRQARSVVS
jgi:hypothetical protein